ncbi:hypothetical protein ACFQ05_21525 [Amycolatopsis umgeniensis]|uniref:Uncharacterized protein n=1 Tax=Amycolatopsis umgeniensis TaxID=336628 RepID=A0A841BGR0_9PSEU|nr:hypothetical protein [Amycolatopsis umgeniensis]MBB5858200.1 hypothetical protein [Amycolatopsis umgeniensis]
MSWFRRRPHRSPVAPESPFRPAAAPPRSEGDPENWTHPLRWRTGAWDQPDLVYAKSHASERYQGWDLYVPNLELVQCGEVTKPAMFFKVGYSEIEDWANAVEPQQINWNWYRTKGEVPYVVIDLHILFVNGNGTAIGVGGAGQVTNTTADAVRHAHQLRSRTLLDPANPAHRQAIEAWVAAPPPDVLFFVEENFRATTYVTSKWRDKRIALEKLAEATNKLDEDGIVPGGFREACAFVKRDLPPVSWWYQ